MAIAEGQNKREPLNGAVHCSACSKYNFVFDGPFIAKVPLKPKRLLKPEACLQYSVTARKGGGSVQASVTCRVFSGYLSFAVLAVLRHTELVVPLIQQ